MATEIRVGKKLKSGEKNVIIQKDDLPDNSSFLNEVVNKIIEKKVEVQLSKYKVGFPKVYNLSIHQLIFKFLSEDNLRNGDFFAYITSILTEALCNEAEKLTVDQSDNTLW